MAPANDIPFFIVGCPRSGTTLVRWMLDEHPRLAIPPESPWLVELAPRHDTWSAARQAWTLDAIVRHPSFADWWLPEPTARSAVARRRPANYAELVATIFATYAQRQSKPRWGGKTPEDVLHIDLLGRLFPGAVFIHVIRDGRAVAASLLEQGWGAGEPVGHAYWWRDCVTAGRAAGQRLGSARYRELRLEDLIADPERELQCVCAAIGESYRPQMLEYTRRSHELEAWAPEARRTHPHVAEPPTPGLRDWKAGLTSEQRNAVQEICCPLLSELGYER